MTSAAAYAWPLRINSRTFSSTSPPQLLVIRYPLPFPYLQRSCPSRLCVFLRPPRSHVAIYSGPIESAPLPQTTSTRNPPARPYKQVFFLIPTGVLPDTQRPADRQAGRRTYDWAHALYRLLYLPSVATCFFPSPILLPLLLFFPQPCPVCW